MWEEVNQPQHLLHQLMLALPRDHKRFIAGIVATNRNSVLDVSEAEGWQRWRHPCQLPAGTVKISICIFLAQYRICNTVTHGMSVIPNPHYVQLGLNRVAYTHTRIQKCNCNMAKQSNECPINRSCKGDVHLELYKIVTAHHCFSNHRNA